MAKDEHVVVINQGLEQRTSQKGKVRYTIAVKSEPVIFNLDPKRMGKPVAEAIIHHLKEKIRGLAAQAAPRTLKAREVERKAYAAGKAWAVARFNGGRTGATPPGTGTQAFNNSGRFANSLIGNASSDGNWRVNVAANRLTDTMTGGAARVWNRLVELVPEFGNPELLLKNDIVRKSVEKATAGIVTKAKESSGALQQQLIRSVLGLIGDVGDLIAG